MTALPKYPLDREIARTGRYDGKFIVGVLSTGIYCLPSCSARRPRPENVRLFETENDAKQAEGCARKALVLASGDRRTQAQAGHLLADALRAEQRNQEASEVERQPFMQ